MGSFGSRTTASQVVANKDLSGKLAVLTGGNQGLGAETVRVLASKGVEVIFTSRDLAAGETAASKIQSGEAKGKIHVVQLDLSDLANVAEAAKSIKQIVGKREIDYLIFNAGVMACPYKLTPYGFEWQIGVNIFGHHRLFQLLEDNLRAQTTPGRIAVLASSAHEMGEIDLDDLHFKHRKYSSWTAYGQSKLANIVWARELNNRLAGTQISVYSVHPGVIGTQLWRYSYFGPLVRTIGSLFLKSVPQGAATTLYALTDESLKGKEGSYLSDCHVEKPGKPEAADPELQRRLYDVVSHQINEALLDTNSQTISQLHS